MLSDPAPVTLAQLTAFAMDSAGYLAPDANSFLKKMSVRKAAISCDGVADSSLSRKSQSQRAVIYQQHMTQAIDRCDADALADAHIIPVQARGLQWSPAEWDPLF